MKIVSYDIPYNGGEKKCIKCGQKRADKKLCGLCKLNKKLSVK